jgi:hypothetical protein
MGKLKIVTLSVVAVACLGSAWANEAVKNTNECNGVLFALQSEYHLTPLDQGYYHSIASKLNQNLSDAMSKAPQSVKDEYAALISGKLTSSSASAGAKDISDYLAASADLGKQWGKDYICPEGYQAKPPTMVLGGDYDYLTTGQCDLNGHYAMTGNIVAFTSVSNDGSLNFSFGIPDEDAASSERRILVKGARYKIKLSSKGMDVGELTTLLAQSSNQQIDSNAPAKIRSELQKDGCIVDASPDQSRSLAAIDALKPANGQAASSGVSTSVKAGSAN